MGRLQEVSTKTANFGVFNHEIPDLVNHPDRLCSFFRVTAQNLKELADVAESSVINVDTNC